MLSVRFSACVMCQQYGRTSQHSRGRQWPSQTSDTLLPDEVSKRPKVPINFIPPKTSKPHYYRAMVAGTPLEALAGAQSRYELQVAVQLRDLYSFMTSRCASGLLDAARRRTLPY
mgnify:CR=1 FL=1